MSDDPDDVIPEATEEDRAKMAELARAVEGETSTVGNQIQRIDERWEECGITSRGIGRLLAAQNLSTASMFHSAVRAMLTDGDGRPLTSSQINSPAIRKRLREAKDMAKAANDLMKSAHEAAAYQEQVERASPPASDVPPSDVEVRDAEESVSSKRTRLEERLAKKRQEMAG